MMPWPWERERAVDREPLLLARLEETLTQLDRRVVDLRTEVDRLRQMREAMERGTPCQSS